MARKEDEKPKDFSVKLLKKSSPTAYKEIITIGATQERERIQSILSIPHATAYANVMQTMAFDGKSTKSDAILALHDAMQGFKSEKKDEFYAGANEVTEAFKNINTLKTDKTPTSSVDAAVARAIAKRGKK